MLSLVASIFQHERLNRRQIKPNLRRCMKLDDYIKRKDRRVNHHQEIWKAWMMAFGSWQDSSSASLQYHKVNISAQILISQARGSHVFLVNILPRFDFHQLSWLYNVGLCLSIGAGMILLSLWSVLLLSEYNFSRWSWEDVSVTNLSLNLLPRTAVI